MIRTKPPKKGKAGRIGLWKDVMLEQAYKLTSQLGATDDDLAEFFGVSVHTITFWKRNKPEFMKCLEEGKAMADQRVVKSLYQRCIGYEHEDVHILSNRVKVFEENEDGKCVLVKEHTEALLVPIVKHYPPDSYAALKWLAIRDRANWTEVKEAKITSTINVMLQNMDLEDVTTEELELMKRLSLGQFNTQNQITSGN